MKKSWLIGLLLSLCISMMGEKIEVTIVAYNEAVATLDTIDVDYYNSTERKGTVSKGQTGTLVLTNMPSCTIESIVIYVKSNKNSGAGRLSIKVDGEETWSTDGSFATWTGVNGFSTEWIPMTCSLGSVKCKESVKIVLSATENSISIDKVVVNYLPTQPSPHCVTYHLWQGQTDSLWQECERTAGDGVLLPSLDDITWEEQTWEFVGWSEKRVLLDSEKPVMLSDKKRYYPREDRDIYAAYCLHPEVEKIACDSALVSGEYAIVALYYDSTYWMAKGGVSQESLELIPCEVEFSAADSLHYLSTSSVPNSSRYQLTIQDDTMQIYHSKSKSYVGCTKNHLSSANTIWWWRALPDASIVIHQPVAENGTAYTLWTNVEGEKNALIYNLSSIRLAQSLFETALWLFPLKDIPNDSFTDLWSTSMGMNVGLPSIDIQTESEIVRKIWVNGRLLLVSPMGTWDTMGRRVE